MYISFYILAMMSFVILLLGSLKVYWLSKEQMRNDRLNCSLSATYTAHSSATKYLHSTFHHHPCTNYFDVIASKIISIMTNKYMLIAMAVLGFLLSLGGLTLSFNRIVNDERTSSNALQQLVNRRLAFNIPDTMEVNAKHNVVASINRMQLIQFLDSELADASSVINVSLVDPTQKSFLIHALTPGSQQINKGPDATWKWTVAPTKNGQADLVLKVIIKTMNDAGRDQKEICFIKTILVSSSFSSRMIDIMNRNWKWLSGVALSFVIFAFTRSWRQE